MHLQKHPSKPGVYTGQANGTWQIKRVGARAAKSWRATKVSGEKFACDPPAIKGRTLAEISNALDTLLVEIAAEIAGHHKAVEAISVEQNRGLMPNPFDGGGK